MTFNHFKDPSQLFEGLLHPVQIQCQMVLDGRKGGLLATAILWPCSSIEAREGGGSPCRLARRVAIIAFHAAVAKVATPSSDCWREASKPEMKMIKQEYCTSLR